VFCVKSAEPIEFTEDSFAGGATLLRVTMGDGSIDFELCQ
jgi:hypothetical protein